jgi:gliding motility-associated-like protein
MIKKIINKTKTYTALLCMALCSGSIMAQDASAIHGSLVVVENEALFDQGDVELSTFSNTGGNILGTSRKIPAYVSFLKASWTGASATSFVDGYVRSYSSGAFTFPIGDNGAYRPAAVSAASISNPVSAAYFHVNPSAAVTTSIFGSNEPVLPAFGPFATTAKQDVIQTVDPTGYWHIQGSSAARISLSWIASTAIAPFTNNNLNNLTIVGWKNNQWVEIPSTVDITSIFGTPSVFGSGSLTTTADIIPNEYGVYTLGAKGISKRRDTIIVVTNTGNKTIGPAVVSDPNIDFRIEGPFNGSGTATIDPKTGLVIFTPVSPAFVGRDIIYKIRCIRIGTLTTCDTTQITIEGKPDRGIPAVDSTIFNTGKILAGLPPISTGGKVYSTTTTSSAGSTVTVDSSGKVNYTPRPGFSGVDTVRVIRCVDNLCDVVTYIVYVKAPPIIKIPNYFSPNGDDKNDVWNLDELLARYPQAKVMIYNRWGNIVWRSKGPYGKSTSRTNVWFGQLEGSQNNVPDGVYYYLLDLEDDLKTTKTGFIELMRQ